MKEMVLAISTIVFLVLLGIFAFKEEPVPLENAKIENYDVIYSDTEYNIMRSKNFNPDQPIYTYAMRFDGGDRTCLYGHLEVLYYVVEYEGSLYSLEEAQKLKVVTCEALRTSMEVE